MCGAVDALSHLMESMYSLSGTGITGRYINFAQQRSILQAMEILVKDPTNYEARENFCYATSLALRGEAQFTNDQDWNVHYLEHAASVWNDKITHGAGLAAIAPWYYRYMYTQGYCRESLNLWSQEVMGEADFSTGIEKFRQIMLSWQAPAGLQGIGITSEAVVDEIVSIFMISTQLGYKSGVYPLSKEAAKAILMEALKH